jgi:hypothetical protein
VIAAGGTVVEVESHQEPAQQSPTWEDAPECPFAPTGRLLVK